MEMRKGGNMEPKMNPVLSLKIVHAAKVKNELSIHDAEDFSYVG